MKIKTSELTGAALDWAVAKCEGMSDDMLNDFDEGDWIYSGSRRYSTNWAQGGPIIERYGVNLSQEFGGSEGSFAIPTGWMARIYKLGGPINPTGYRGPTPLIAAMRCFASKLGDEVELPKELV